MTQTYSKRALTSSIYPFLLLYVSSRGCGLPVMFWHLFFFFFGGYMATLHSAYSLSWSLFGSPTWIYSDKPLVKTDFFSSMNINNIYRRISHIKWHFLRTQFASYGVLDLKGSNRLDHAKQRPECGKRDVNRFCLPIAILLNYIPGTSYQGLLP